MKILSPAGNFESLKAAVYNGADEVYLGINNFNARNNIDGFTIENIKEAIDFAHLFGVKINLAINILFDDDELQQALDTIVETYNLGVDSYIIQDIGLASLVHKFYPQIEMHASTQMGIHNLEGVKFLENLGFKRIVLARETSLEEVKRIKQNSNVELEYFAQGALCVSFSGNCYLSSYLCNASGNRGKCKQLCRLPYSFGKDNQIITKGFLLSAKDFDMRKRLNDLKNAGIDVIKIEGRARRPAYVAMTTREYCNILNGKAPNNDNIELSFNRDYTEGYFNGNDRIISKFNNHIGKKIGKVIKFVSGKKFNEIYISSSRKLNSKSTFKFFDGLKEIATVTAYDLKQIEKNEYKITTTQNIKVGCDVNLILDNELEETALSLIKKIPLQIEIEAIVNKPITAKITTNQFSLKLVGDVCEVAQKAPLQEKDFVETFSKTTIFDVKLTCKLENIFLTKQKLNSFRRYVFDEITNLLKNNDRTLLQKTQIQQTSTIKKFNNFKYINFIEENFDTKNIIFSPETYEIETIKKFIDKCLRNNCKPFLDTPNFATEQDIILLKDIIDKTNIAIIANNYYALSFETEIVIGPGLNVFNHISSNFYDKSIITAESDISNKVNFPYMTLRHCPFKTNLKCSCANCPYKDNFYYQMDNGKKLFIKRKKLSSCTFYLV